MVRTATQRGVAPQVAPCQEVPRKVGVVALGLKAKSGGFLLQAQPQKLGAHRLALSIFMLILSLPFLS